MIHITIYCRHHDTLTTAFMKAKPYEGSHMKVARGGFQAKAITTFTYENSSAWCLNMSLSNQALCCF